KEKSNEAPTLFAEESESVVPEPKKVVGKYENLTDLSVFIHAPHVAFYMITQGNECQGIGLSMKNGEAAFISPEHIQWDKLKAFFESPNKKTGHDIKQSLNFLKGKGISINGELFESMVAHFFIKPEGSPMFPDVAT